MKIDKLQVGQTFIRTVSGQWRGKNGAAHQDTAVIRCEVTQIDNHKVNWKLVEILSSNITRPGGKVEDLVATQGWMNPDMDHVDVFPDKIEMKGK